MLGVAHRSRREVEFDLVSRTVNASPLVVVVAGPNGAGKSTTAPSILRGPLAVHEFVNADSIAAGLSAFRPESVAIAAGRIMLQRMRTLVNSRMEFAFETTLASRSFAPWIKELRASGYRAHLVFLALPSEQMAVSRVERRVSLGGHSVPEEVVRRRFRAGLRNFFGVYSTLVDSWEVLDASAQPRRIAKATVLNEPVVVDRIFWDSLRKQVEP